MNYIIIYNTYLFIYNLDNAYATYLWSYVVIKINWRSTKEVIMIEHICIICGYIHRGDAPPEICPLCGALSDQFDILTPENRDKYAHLLIDTHS